ncbi:hypothetical protein CGZ93_10050 [Enemella dayhoffiae]|uniref:Uncharacterized protein n=1 Tax=Enemella dayhoffiae TaxID=2016507 RepID=A0A255H3H6_9ACTN|nr:hypothetical protein [Enemella dayhoffiae]OYO21633.1 hypothetical protein CGZ93_10050 [Enemella dayhoffiae]
MQQQGSVDHVVAALQRRGRRFRIEHDQYLVLDSGLAQRLSDLAYAVEQALVVSGPPEAAADRVVADLLAREERLAAGDLPPIQQVRLRLTHDDLLPGGGTLPGPADLVVFPVHDTADSATRLTTAQVDALGEVLARSGTPGRSDLERVGVAAMPATLAEPVSVHPESWSGHLAVLVSGDLYTASRLLDLPRLLGQVGIPAEQDVLVGVSSSRELWLVPVVPGVIAELARELDARVAAAYAVSRGQIAQRAYLWSAGQLRSR